MERKKDNVARSVKRLLWTYIGIVIFCAVVLAVNMVLTGIGAKDPKSPYGEEGVCTWVMDQRAPAEVYYVKHEAEGAVEGVKADVYFTKYDVRFSADDPKLIGNAYLTWGHIFHNLHMLAVVLAVVFGLMCAVSFYKSVKRGDKFSHRYIKFMRWVGVMIIVSASCVLLAKMMHSLGVAQLLPASMYKPHLQVEVGIIHFIFGVVVLFLSRVLEISYKLQEEQEYTV